MHPGLMFLGDWAGSLAFKLDPYWQFKKTNFKGPVRVKNSLTPDIDPVQVVPANRIRKFPCIYGQPIRSYWQQHSVSWAENLVFVNGAWTLVQNTPTETVTEGSHADAAQLTIYGYILDTTDSTRNPQRESKKESRARLVGIAGKRKKREKQTNTSDNLNHQGEFELWKFEFHTDEASAQIYTNDTFTYQKSAFAGPHGEELWARSHVTQVYNEGFRGSPSASISKADVDSLAISERAKATSIMTKNCDRMVAQCLPNRRYYNTIYQIAELRDVISTLKGTLELWILLERELGKGVFLRLLTQPSFWTDDLRLKVVPFARLLHLDIRPDQILSAAYLNFKFGWQSMVEAFTKLASAPERVTKDINRLIDANGQNVTLRSKFKFSEPMTSLPTITFDKVLHTSIEAGVPPSFVGTRDVEVRCSVNSGLNLPKVDLPSLRKNLFNEKMGAVPTPGDVYDILPWTWLIDWVFGASDYLHLMDAVNGQRNMVNYGLITYESHMRVDGRWRNWWPNFHRVNMIPPNGIPAQSVRIDQNRSNSFHAKYVLRKNVMAFAGLSDYSGVGSTPYQRSILAALFSQFSRNSSVSKLANARQPNINPDIR